MTDKQPELPAEVEQMLSNLSGETFVRIRARLVEDAMVIQAMADKLGCDCCENNKRVTCRHDEPCADQQSKRIAELETKMSRAVAEKVKAAIRLGGRIGMIDKAEAIAIIDAHTEGAANDQTD